jgi:type VI secretion system protein ImpC
MSPNDANAAMEPSDENPLRELFRKAKVRDEESRVVQGALTELMKRVVAGHTIEKDAERQINSLIAHINQKLSDQVNEVIHDPKFQKLEATWRGLKYLVDNTNSGPMLKIKVMNLDKPELVKDFDQAGTTERSIMYHKIVRENYGMAGGRPFGMLMGDFEFTHRPEDMFILQEMAKISAVCHSPFIAGASPQMLGLESFGQLGGPDKIAGVFDGAAYAKWRSFRDADDSRYVGLTMPHVLGRLPFGRETKKVDGFDFEENVDGQEHDKYLWMNAAWTYAARVTDAFDQDGWLARTRGLEGGGKVDNLPIHTYFDRRVGGLVNKCPTEVQLPMDRELELSDLGFLPLIHWQNTDYAAFIGTQSCHKPGKFVGPEGEATTANAQLAAKLNYTLSVSRFSHFLKILLTTWLGKRMSREELERKLNDWINSYVVDNPENLPERERYRYPLKEARIEVKPIPGNPGWYEAVCRMRPHLHLEGATISMRLVEKMPPPKAS